MGTVLRHSALCSTLLDKTDKIVEIGSTTFEAHGFYVYSPLSGLHPLSFQLAGMKGKVQACQTAMNQNTSLMPVKFTISFITWFSSVDCLYFFRFANPICFRFAF